MDLYTSARPTGSGWSEYVVIHCHGGVCAGNIDGAVPVIATIAYRVGVFRRQRVSASGLRHLAMPLVARSWVVPVSSSCKRFRYVRCSALREDGIPDRLMVACRSAALCRRGTGSFVVLAIVAYVSVSLFSTSGPLPRCLLVGAVLYSGGDPGRAEPAVGRHGDAIAGQGMALSSGLHHQGRPGDLGDGRLVIDTDSVAGQGRWCSPSLIVGLVALAVTYASPGAETWRRPVPGSAGGLGEQGRRRSSAVPGLRGTWSRDPGWTALVSRPARSTPRPPSASALVVAMRMP